MEEDTQTITRNGNGNERRLAAVERDVAVIRSNYATKEDLVKLESKVQDRLSRLDNNLSEMENRLIRWFFATTVSLAAVAFSAGKFL
ncbi:hypothetical protein IP92_03851 [Pseudoduganella flava]|uniref:DUF1640 domain-containing protein n=1 Tax=Pseudoduganella flava TaxID=871742 RepID=A0A562PMP5_9BURK|nr:hypothetical protein [Pseudoduganella flava]QGZ40856.1 hypothetical protein GO485_18470 [Pseudoduganella flava]TWI45470.1 hypothetical protein IP92_03851 [Pseudoduganella flava]